MAGEVRRLHDMGPSELRLLRCDDGDVHLTIVERDDDGAATAIADVEFCNSGTDSPHTYRALAELEAAMHLDELERPQGHRRGPRRPPVCPGEECTFCTGEHCATHGSEPCECDGMERHE